MPEKIHLWPEDAVQDNDSITLAATLERPDGTRRRLWYRIPATCRDAVTTSSDPFVLGFLFNVMRFSADLNIHGQVSPSLLRNLVEFQDAWVSWLPKKYTRVEMTADHGEESSTAGTDETIMGFSGGVDSTYSAWRHRLGSKGQLRRNLVTGAMVHGFDIPLVETEIFARAAERSRRMLASLGMGLILVATNFREISDTWEESFGTGLASTLSILQGRYRFGLIASSYI